ncbi:MAG: CoA transferase, partial [Pseudomonadota bacterium]
RVQAQDRTIPICTEIFLRYTKAELEEIFEEIGIPFAPVARPSDLVDDPQLNAGDRMLHTRMPNGVSTKLPRLPVEIGGHDLGLRQQPPEIGEHTHEILRELGLDDSDLAELEGKGIIVAPPAAAAD